MPFLKLGIVVTIFIALCVGTAYYCYKRVFYAPKRKPRGENECEIPDGDVYEVYREQIVAWIKQVRSMPRESVEITSFDGLKLRGKYYEYQAGAPVELLFNGYRGYGERDLSGGVERCFALGRNVIIIDQRSCGESEGNTTTFGIKERLDCLKWIEFAIERFGKDVKIIIGGVSMGGATVLMAAGETLPENVVCVMSDCGYSSSKEIIKKVVKDMKLPVGLVYPFIKLGARWFGKFDLDETSPLESVQRARVPVIFIHGDYDDFVPWEMSKKLYEACASKKRFVTIEGAGHGLAYPANKKKYVDELREFEKEWMA